MAMNDEVVPLLEALRAGGGKDGGAQEVAARERRRSSQPPRSSTSLGRSGRMSSLGLRMRASRSIASPRLATPSST